MKDLVKKSIILAVIAIVFILGAAGPIIIVDGQLAKINGEWVTLRDGRVLHTSYVSKYTYIGLDFVGVKTRENALEPPSPPSSACYVQYPENVTACWSDGYGLAKVEDYYLYYSEGVVAVVWPRLGVVAFEYASNPIIPDFFEWRTLGVYSWIDASGRTVSSFGRTYYVAGDETVETYVIKHTTLAEPSFRSILVYMGTGDVRCTPRWVGYAVFYDCSTVFVDFGTKVYVPYVNVALGHELLLIKNSITTGSGYAACARKKLAHFRWNGTYVFIPTNETTGVAAFVWSGTIFIGDRTYTDPGVLDSFGYKYGAGKSAYIITVSGGTIVDVKEVPVGT